MDLPLMLKPRERNYFCCFNSKIYEGRIDLFSENYVHWGLFYSGDTLGTKASVPLMEVGLGFVYF